jgi:hypothetical protein
MRYAALFFAFFLSTARADGVPMFVGDKANPSALSANVVTLTIDGKELRFVRQPSKGVWVGVTPGENNSAMLVKSELGIAGEVRYGARYFRVAHGRITEVKP